MTLASLILPAAGAVAAAAGFCGYGLFHPRSRLFAPVVYSASSPASPTVALTFDDGPNPEATPRVLDILAEHRVPAAFFVIGLHARRHPDLIRRMDAEGHLVANHTFHHHRLGLIHGRRYWEAELRDCEQVIEHIIGKRPALFRPPMGFKHPRLAAAARTRNQSIITWTRRGFDGVATHPDRALKRLASRLAPGDILALHDGLDPAAKKRPIICPQILPHLLDTIQDGRLAIARLDELIQRPAYL